MKSKFLFCVLFFITGSAFAATSETVQVAITIDDLPAAGINPVGETRTDVANRILEVLKKHKLNGVYGFVNGSIVVNMAERAAILKAWKKAGHLVGNHTYSHPDLGKMSATDYIADIEKNETTLIDYADTISELKVFRYPFLSEGDTSDKRYAIRSYLKNRNYQIAPVSVDFLDWDWIEAFGRCKTKNSTDDLAKLESTYLRSAQEQLLYSERMKKFIYGADKKFPYVLLLHFSQVTATYLDQLLTAYEKMNVKWISLQDALKSKVYDEDTAFIDKDGESFLPQAAASRKLSSRTIYQPEAETKKLEKMCL